MVAMVPRPLQAEWRFLNVRWRAGEAIGGIRPI
jgi:hypothetical protein